MTDTPDIDVWTTPLGRWRLATVEWLRRRRESPEALSDDGRPSGDDSGDVPFGNLSIPTEPTDPTDTTETLQ